MIGGCQGLGGLRACFHAVAQTQSQNEDLDPRVTRHGPLNLHGLPNTIGNQSHFIWTKGDARSPVAVKSVVDQDEQMNCFRSSN